MIDLCSIQKKETEMGRRNRYHDHNVAELNKSIAETRRKIEEAKAKRLAEREAIIAMGLDPDSPEFCEICKAGAYAGPVHGNCLYGGNKIGHTRGHCSANACY
jgi:hypothetical protein